MSKRYDRIKKAIENITSVDQLRKIRDTLALEDEIETAALRTRAGLRILDIWEAEANEQAKRN